jgi:hypothetical protein
MKDKEIRRRGDRETGEGRAFPMRNAPACANLLRQGHEGQEVWSRQGLRDGKRQRRNQPRFCLRAAKTFSGVIGRSLILTPTAS